MDNIVTRVKLGTMDKEKHENLNLVVGNLSGDILLPYVPTVKIFSYLNIKDRMSCSAVCKSWRDIIFSPFLWKEVYPTQWVYGLWDIRPCSHPRLDARKLANAHHHRVWMEKTYPFVIKLKGNLNDVEQEPTINRADVQLFKDAIRECQILTGFMEYVLPHIGSGIQKCVLQASSVIGDCLLNCLLLACPNLTHLDVSYTAISEDAFDGLWDYDACVNLRHLNLSCCYNLTDASISNLVKALIKIEGNSVEKNQDDDDSLLQIVPIASIVYEVKDACRELLYVDNVGSQQHWLLSNENGHEYISLPRHKANRTKHGGLQFLNLSGCCMLTDDSLFKLATCKIALSSLEFLDISGNWHFTSEGLKVLVDSCPSLKPENLYYCHSLQNGPFQFEANGCSNLQSATRPCCTPPE